MRSAYHYYVPYAMLRRHARPSRSPGEWLRLLTAIEVDRAIEGGELLGGFGSWFA